MACWEMEYPYYLQLADLRKMHPRERRCLYYGGLDTEQIENFERPFNRILSTSLFTYKLYWGAKFEMDTKVYTYVYGIDGP
ncbi:MAG: hypothetical protein Q9226_005927 [Calogaya cf. arnoldii]